jgi:transposase InsO family protein
VSCGQAHSQARELVARGKEPKLVAETLSISRSSLYYRKRAHRSRAHRGDDERIVAACGEKPAYGYRRVAWWLQRKRDMDVNGKRVLRVMRERGLLVRQGRYRVSRRKDWSRVEAPQPNLVWQSDMTRVWAGPSTGWSYLVSVIDCCTREIVGWDLSLRCRTGEALSALEQAVLEHLPHGPRGLGLTLTTDNGTQFHLGELHRNPQPARHPAPPHCIQPPRGKQLHRTLPPQSQRRGGLDQRVSELRPRTAVHRSLDRRI